MKSGVLTAAFVVVSVLLLAIFALMIMPVEAANGAECKAIKGICAKSCSSTTQVDNGKMDCGTKGWFTKVQTTCCTKKPCSDGTPQGSCSTVDKPKYCNTAAKLVDLPSRCPCPDGLVKKGGKCVTPTPAPVKKTQCDDGTRIGNCSITKPKWCNANAALIDSPKTCGCPDGQVYNKYSAKCVTSAPTTPIPGSYCVFMPEDTACSGGKCKGGKCVTPAPTATPTKTPTPVSNSTPTKTPTPVPAATASCSDTDTASTGTTAVFDYGTQGTCTDTGSTKICPYGCSDACASGNENKLAGN